MKVGRAIQEGLRMLRFENVRTRYQAGTLGCEGAAELLGVASAGLSEFLCVRLVRSHPPLGERQ